MPEQYCKLCGYRGGAGESCCPDCGAPLLEVPAELLTAETGEPEQVDIKRKKRDWLPRGRTGLAAGFLALCLAVQGLGLWRLSRPVDPGWSYVDGRCLVTAQGVWSFDGNGWLNSYGENAGPCRVLPMWRVDVLGGSSGMEVWFYDGQSVEKTPWADAQLSGDGQVLFYLTCPEDGEETITRRELRSGRETEIVRGRWLSFAAPSDYTGAALAYYTDVKPYQDQFIGIKPHLWQLGAGSRELEEQVYYLGEHGDSYLTWNQEDWRQNVVWNGGERRLVVNYDMRMDRDLTEVLYMDDQGDWHYEDQEGRTQKLEGLPSYCSLDAVRPGDRYSDYGPEHLTDQVYLGSGGVLYYLDEDLNVTRLTSAGTVDQLRLTADGERLYYIHRPTGQKAQLWSMERGRGGWKEPRKVVDEVHSYVLCADGETICARFWEGKNLSWKIRDGDGAWRSLDNIHPRALEQDVLPMDGGGCWYRGAGTSQHRELWYRAPSGETTLKMAHTSLLSSTLYPTDQEAEVLLTGLTDEEFRDIEDIAFVDLGRGDVALLRVDYAVTTKVKLYTSAYGLNRGQADYWLLESDGTMTKLEAMEP